MVSTKERVRAESIVGEQDGQKVLNFIADEKVVTLEMIVERFPWLRWGDLFSRVGGFRRGGLVTIHQVGSHLEVRIKESIGDVIESYGVMT